MRLCVIFNPTARGEKARRFRGHLDEFADRASLRSTQKPGDGERLAAEALAEGFDTIVAAGGDGTVNEVLNGLAAAPGGLENARLAVLPLGTVNVFARELGLPTGLQQAWGTILQGRETTIDLPRAEFRDGDMQRKRFFAQMAGAGLDARAIELVHYPLKKKIGPLAYIYAGLKALRETPANILVQTDRASSRGGLVLIGNGKFYGGPYQLFPNADFRDGLLEVSVFPKVDWLTLAHCGPNLLLRRRLPKSAAVLIQASELTLSSDARVAFEVDGEWAGHLPVRFCIARKCLRVVVPW